MRLRALLLRILRALVITAVAVVLLAFAFVQIQQRLLRHRAERLLADFQAIRLGQSNWEDAQRLMRRWGAWGHYEGTCTEAGCSYQIRLWDDGTLIDSRLSDFFAKHWPQSYSGNRFHWTYNILGGRGAEMGISFLVQDGVIRRSSVGFGLGVTPKEAKNIYGYELMLTARANDHLRMNASDHQWILGENDQLARHPEYKVGRPGGCMICMSGELTFTPFLPVADLRRMTNYDLSCLTRWHHPCLLLQDVLPEAKIWDLYGEGEPHSGPPSHEVLPKSCQIPVFALARDIPNIVVVDALSTTKKAGQPGAEYPENRESETARVRVAQVLRGSSNLSPNYSFEVRAYSGDHYVSFYAGQALEAGKRYVLFLDDPPSDAEMAASPFVLLDQCTALEDSPEVRNQIVEGLARLDPLRRADTFGSPLW
jgi:hypothetical protein